MEPTFLLSLWPVAASHSFPPQHFRPAGYKDASRSQADALNQAQGHFDRLFEFGLGQLRPLELELSATIGDFELGDRGKLCLWSSGESRAPLRRANSDSSQGTRRQGRKLIILSDGSAILRVATFWRLESAIVFAMVSICELVGPKWWVQLKSVSLTMPGLHSAKRAIAGQLEALPEGACPPSEKQPEALNWSLCRARLRTIRVAGAVCCYGQLRRQQQPLSMRAGGRRINSMPRFIRPAAAPFNDLGRISGHLQQPPSSSPS